MDSSISNKWSKSESFWMKFWCRIFLDETPEAPERFRFGDWIFSAIAWLAWSANNGQNKKSTAQIQFHKKIRKQKLLLFAVFHFLFMSLCSLEFVAVTFHAWVDMDSCEIHTAAADIICRARRLREKCLKCKHDNVVVQFNEHRVLQHAKWILNGCARLRCGCVVHMQFCARTETNGWLTGSLVG